MPNSLEQNFAVAAQLSSVASAKIQAMLRCLQDNTDTRIDLSDPQEQGNSVSYTIVSGNQLDLEDCCDLRKAIYFLAFLDINAAAPK